MHKAIEERLLQLEKTSKKIRSYNSTLNELEALAKGLTCENFSQRLDLWGDLEVAFFVMHIRDITPILTKLYNEFGIPSYKSVETKSATFHYTFKSKDDIKFNLRFHMAVNSSCKLVEKSSHEETRTITEYEMVCNNGESKVITDEDIEKEE